MTSSTLTKSHGRRGFTLVEMLVVIGIILLLITIALPVINRARKTALRTRMAADLQVIAMGLEAYKGDFKDYPRLDYTLWVNNPALPSPLNTQPNKATWTNPHEITPGAVLLCWALVGPGPAVRPTGSPANFAADGADGLGFRARGTSGQVYGPYIATGRFKIFDVSNPTATVINDALCTINDHYGHPILYFPLTTANNNAGAKGGFIDDWVPTAVRTAASPPIPVINAHDNITAFEQGSASDQPMALKRIQMMLGDQNHDGILDNGESLPANLPYVLWSAGPDEIYGPTLDMNAPDAEILSKLSGVDDVTNLP
ncbi:MAG: hypothetical protein JWP03_1685 [Phycisphaerales bacterium]|nr:hypothetical protein [Phycisphaerales bacterium]